MKEEKYIYQKNNNVTRDKKKKKKLINQKERNKIKRNEMNGKDLNQKISRPDFRVNLILAHSSIYQLICKSSKLSILILPVT